MQEKFEENKGVIRSRKIKEGQTMMHTVGTNQGHHEYNGRCNELFPYWKLIHFVSIFINWYKWNGYGFAT
jgi:hypothetical protein